MLRPKVECASLLARVACAIVDARDPRLVAADMVDNGFDDVRLDAEVGHAGRDRAADIVQAPRCWRMPECGRHTGVESALGVAPSLKGAIARAEYEVAALP